MKFNMTDLDWTIFPQVSLIAQGPGILISIHHGDHDE